MARFFPETGLLIQHIPRTGGTFVKSAIDVSAARSKVLVVRWISQQCKKTTPKHHSLLSHYYRESMAKVKRVACFVRHPVDYYSSTWRYLHEHRLVSYRRLAILWTKWRWHPFRQAGLLYKPDFAEWVDAMLESEPAWATRLMELFVGPEGGEFCDFIGRTETLVPDLLDLLPRFGVPVSEDELIAMGRPNRSGPRSLVAIPDELREQICREERVLIRRFYGPDTEAKRWYGTRPA